MDKQFIRNGLASLAVAIAVSMPVSAASTHWDYSAEGADWGSLVNDLGDIAFPTCGNGLQQSPIDIRRAGESRLDKIEFHYREQELNVLNNGHTLEVEVANGSHITIGGKRYELLQFHFHTPSEHAVQGERSAMEVHFVHQNRSDLEIAVVGVMIDAGRRDNTLFGEILENQPLDANGEPVPGHTETHIGFNPEEFLPRERDEFYNYMGSLTTPPCSEGLRWFVMDDQIRVSGHQVEEFSHVVHGANARALQPLNGRKVRKADD